MRGRILVLCREAAVEIKSSVPGSVSRSPTPFSGTLLTVFGYFAMLLAQLTGAVALKIFIAGFVACTIPPFIVWAIGFHVFKINPAVLMGGVAGARSHSGPAREAAVEIQSSVPWIGFPVGYAVSGILLTVFGYFAMILAQ